MKLKKVGVTGDTNSQESQICNLHIIQLMIRIRNQLPTSLRLRKRRHRFIHVLRLRKECRFALPVHARTARDDRIDHLVYPRVFQHAGRSLNVGTDVQERILDGRTDSRACCEVAYPLGLVRLKDFVHQFLIVNVSLVDCQQILGFDVIIADCPP